MTDRGGSLLQKGAQLHWKVPPLILSFGGWLCSGVFSSEGKFSGLCPMCFDAVVPKLVIYLWLQFFLLEGDVHSLIPMGSDLSGVVPWLWWWVFLTFGLCLPLLHSSFILPFEVEDLLEGEAQPMEEASSWLEEVGWRFGGLGGHRWRSFKPVIIEHFNFC